MVNRRRARLIDRVTPTGHVALHKKVDYAAANIAVVVCHQIADSGTERRRIPHQPSYQAQPRNRCALTHQKTKMPAAGRLYARLVEVTLFNHGNGVFFVEQASSRQTGSGQNGRWVDAHFLEYLRDGGEHSHALLTRIHQLLHGVPISHRSAVTLARSSHQAAPNAKPSRLVVK